eukprot:CAMPEP_0185838244 /NCGR_PEP_ID=MMETSP1353-20130828/12763_1 /TAXON_ID=1077150 /ORGANISM="Erythrolobus australicus, Strain CCMP3124" /LENGTH=132 /DNA_ID=CAMNT_0028537279 /DNA_START=685 /DNA_END=1083 /DNA_ORIENTATION=+
MGPEPAAPRHKASLKGSSVVKGTHPQNGKLAKVEHVSFAQHRSRCLFQHDMMQLVDTGSQSSCSAQIHRSHDRLSAIPVQADLCDVMYGMPMSRARSIVSELEPIQEEGSTLFERDFDDVAENFQGANGEVN